VAAARDEGGILDLGAVRVKTPNRAEGQPDRAQGLRRRPTL